MTADVLVRITQRARDVLEYATALEMLENKIMAERRRHDQFLAEEAERYERQIEILRAQQQVIEQAIYRLGQN